MNERIKQLAEQAGVKFTNYGSGDFIDDGDCGTYHLQKFAELIVRECTSLLFDESERLYGYSTECDNMRESDEAELVAEKCVDLITMIEQHFGVEE